MIEHPARATTGITSVLRFKRIQRAALHSNGSAVRILKQTNPGASYVTQHGLCRL